LFREGKIGHERGLRLRFRPANRKEDTPSALRVIGMAFTIVAERDDPVERKTIQIQIFAGDLAAVRPGRNFAHPAERQSHVYHISNRNIHYFSLAAKCDRQDCFATLSGRRYRIDLQGITYSPKSSSTSAVFASFTPYSYNLLRRVRVEIPSRLAVLTWLRS
jgi:hypothetical protein